MRLYTLILALLAVGARAATISDKSEADFEKKLTEVVKDVMNKDEAVPVNIASVQEVIDQANGIQDVENNLRNRVKIVDIPVKVVVEDVKASVKSDKENDNEVTPEDEIKRPEVDLKNPGLPQRMQHDNQNPDHFEDHQPAVSGLKQNIDTQNIFNNGPNNFQQNLQTWFEQNQQLVQIQQYITQLQQNFQNQINMLNSTVQKFFKPSDKPSEAFLTEAQNTVQSGLKMIEDNVKSGVKSLADGVHTITGAKQNIINNNNNNNSTGGFPGFGSGGFPWQNMFQSIQAQITHGFQNLTNNLQNYFNGTQSLTVNPGNGSSSSPTNIFQNWSQNVQNLFNQGGSGSNQSATAESDDPNTPRPTIWQNIQNIFNPLGNQQPQNDPVAQPQPNRPIANAIQGVVSFIQPTRRPENSQPPAAAAPQQGSNAVPAEPVNPQASEQKEKPVEYVESGPIKQLIEKNPIVQSIAGAVQRIQYTINPEKPRDTVKDGEKGLLFKPDLIHGGHGGHGGHGSHGSHGGLGGSASGDTHDSNVSGVAAKSESAQKEEVPQPAKPSEEIMKTETAVTAKKD